MVGTSAVSSSTTQQSTSSAATSSHQLGKDDFLKLLTAQLANQDPTEPVHNQAFVAQMAQFSSLEQLQNVSTQLATLVQATTSSTQLGAASLVGKSATYQTDGVTLVSGQPPVLQAHLGAPASVAVIIQDASGRVVRTLSLASHDAGTFDVEWDGKDDDGNSLPAGRYAVRMAATAADGSAATVQACTTGPVQAVAFATAGPRVVVAGNQVDLSNVFQITQ